MMERLSEAVANMVVPRWGEVVSTTPLTVRLDAGRGVIPSPASVIDPSVGDRVLVLRWGTSAVVVGRVSDETVMGDVWLEWTTLPWMAATQTVIFNKRYAVPPSVQVQVIGGSGVTQAALISEVIDGVTYYTGATVVGSGTGASIAFQAIGRVQ